jgi:hypothetical protein
VFLELLFVRDGSLCLAFRYFSVVQKSTLLVHELCLHGAAGSVFAHALMCLFARFGAKIIIVFSNSTERHILGVAVVVLFAK